MADITISSMPVLNYNNNLQLPAIDLTKPAGQQNGKITTGTLATALITQLTALLTTESLSTDTLVLSFQNGILTWIPVTLLGTSSNSSGTFNLELEDDTGGFLLEDGTGYIEEET